MRNRRPGYTLVESLVVVPSALAIVGIGVAALFGCFSLQTLNSHIMDAVVVGITLVSCTACVVLYLSQKRRQRT